MRPPRCAVCHVRFGPDEGGLVTFALDERAHAFHARRQAEPGFIGHPPEQEWFCAAHLAAALSLTMLTRPEALERLRTTS
jgi:hypothetical protein